MHSTKLNPTNRMLLRRLKDTADEEWIELCCIRGLTVRGYTEGEGYVVYGSHANIPVDSMQFDFFEAEVNFGSVVGPTYDSVLKAMKNEIVGRISNSVDAWEY